MIKRKYVFRAREKSLDLGLRTRLMGVVNITPDSFSDGGKFFEAGRAVAHCLALVEAGADFLDLGAESSRPGSSPVSVSEELKRLLPVLQEVRSKVEVMISIDTCKASVAEECLKCGADVINDISAFRADSRMSGVVSDWKAGVVLMHMRGKPSSMHLLPPSRDILEEVRKDLQVSVNQAYNSKIPRDRILLDPGIGFGKNTEENLRILNQLSFLEEFDLPLLVGPSRKRFIGHVLNAPVEDRVLGTAAVSAVAILKGTHVLRVHDVAAIRQVSTMVDTISAEKVLE